MSVFKRKRVYLDWAASAPVAPEVHLAFERALRAYGNPSSPHQEGVEAQLMLAEARRQMARLTEVKPEGVIFTSGATEANNLALRGQIRRLREQGIAAADLHVLYLPSAHASVGTTLEALAQEGVSIESLTLTEGILDLADLKQKLRPETRLVVLDAVCGETGVRYPTRAAHNALSAYAKEHGTQRALLHVDASQLPLAFPFDLTRLAADTVTYDAQKVGGVRGIGALCMRGHVPLSPIMTGGGQEQGMRPGTEPVALAVAFVAALTEASEQSAGFVKKAAEWRNEVLSSIRESIPDVYVNEGKDQAPHILNISLPGRDTDYLVMLLDQAGYAVSTKSACESDSDEGSRAVLAFTQDPARAAATLRISWGPVTHLRDLRRFAAALANAVLFIDTHEFPLPPR